MKRKVNCINLHMYLTTCKMILQTNSGGCHCCHLYICGNSWKPVDSKKYFPGLKIEKVLHSVYFPGSYKQCRPPTTQVAFATAGDQFSDGEIHSLRQRCARTKATRTKATFTYLPILLLHSSLNTHWLPTTFPFFTLLLSLAFHPWHCPF